MITTTFEGVVNSFGCGNVNTMTNNTSGITEAMIIVIMRLIGNGGIRLLPVSFFMEKGEEK